MPNIPDRWMDAVCFLYPSEDAAWASEPAGGTGFLVSVVPDPPLDDPELAHVYIVANDHVARSGAPVVRMNLVNGGFDVLDFSGDDWIPHPEGDDLAILPLGFAGPFRYASIEQKLFLTPEIIEHYRIGPGDDTFMIGRYANLDGTDQNRPTARFGNLSSMPSQSIDQRPDRNFKQESLLVETRSLSGYSGSPVFVHPAPYIDKDEVLGMVVKMLAKSPVFFMGIDWGHHPVKELVRSPVTKGKPVPERTYVRSNSGMTMVIPAWRLQRLLFDAEVTKMRKKIEEEYRAEHRADEAVAVLDVAEGDSEATFTREAFMHDLGKATRRKAPLEREG